MTFEEFRSLAENVGGEGDSIQARVAEHLKSLTGRKLRALGITTYSAGQTLLMDDVSNVERLIANACGVTVETVEDLPAALWSVAIDGARAGFFVALGAQMK